MGSLIRGNIDRMHLPIRIPTFLRGLGLLPILAVTVVAAPLLPVPIQSVRWHGMQGIAVEVGGVFLLMAALCRPWPPSFFVPPPLRQISLLCLHGLLLWALVSCLRDPSPFAVQSLLTLGFEVLAADVVAAQVTDQRRLTFLVYAVLLAAALVCGLGLIGLGSAAAALASGPLHDHQLFGAFMTLPLLLSLALSFGGGTQSQRLAGQAALLLCLTGVWEAQDRAAWLGLAASLLVFAGLFVWTRQGAKPLVRTATLVPVLLVLAAALGAALLSPNRDQVVARLQSVARAPDSRHDSRLWREQVWAGTRRMIAEKPLWGWGVGAFPVLHQPWTGTGHRAGEVYADGPSIEDEAHNSYLQLWAELGGIGLALWLAALGALGTGGARALARYPARSLPQWVLIGGLSAVAGQMMDALANPAWQFGQVALPLWLVLGLTAALTCPAETAHRHARRSALVPARLVPARLGQAALAAGTGAALLWLIWRTAFALPVPSL